MLGKSELASKFLSRAQTLGPEDKVAVKKIRDIMDKNKKPKEPVSKEMNKK